MKKILPYILATLTQHDRQLVVPGTDFTWSSNCWTHNVFRVYELVFGRRAGIRWEGTSYLNEDGETVQISGTVENFFAVFEGAVRAYLKSWSLNWRIVYVPQLAGIPMGLQSPFMFAIAFDVAATFDGGGSAAASFTYSHTCTGSNLTLVSQGYFNAAGAPSVTSVTYNSVALTNGQTFAAGNQNTFIYYLAAPSTGSNSILLTPSKSCLGSFGSTSYTGTSATPAGAGAQNSSPVGGSTTPNTPITTTAANSWVVDLVELDGTVAAFSATTTGSGQTSRFDSSAFGPTNQSIAGSSMTTTSAGSYTPAWSVLLNTDWQTVAFEIKALATATNSGFFMAAAR